MNLPSRLRAARENYALTQVELARLLGCSQSRVSDIEGGKRGLSVERLQRWAAACGCRLALERKLPWGC